MKHKDSETILSRFTIYAYSEDMRIKLDKRKFFKAIKYGDIEWDNELLSYEAFIIILSDFLENHDNGENSFYFFCDYTKKNSKLKVNCLADNGELEQKLLRRRGNKS